jgi:hypothetical protein
MKAYNIYMDLNSNNIIWSKGPIHDDYSKKQTERTSSITDIQNIIKSVTNKNNVVFIRNGSGKNVRDLDLFADNLYLLNFPIILITSDGDRPMPSSHDFNKIVTNC